MSNSSPTIKQFVDRELKAEMLSRLLFDSLDINQKAILALLVRSGYVVGLETDAVDSELLEFARRLVIAIAEDYVEGCLNHEVQL